MFWAVFARGPGGIPGKTSKLQIPGRSDPFNDRFKRGILLLVAGWAVLSATAASGRGVSLVWNSNTEPDIAGYVLYSGTNSRSYDKSNFVGNVTSNMPIGFMEGVNYFVAVTAKNVAGLESDFSNELSFILPITGETPPAFWVTNVLSPFGLTLTWPSTPGAVFQVLYKVNVSDNNWMPLTSDLTATNEVMSWTDKAVDKSATRFYRIIQTQ